MIDLQISLKGDVELTKTLKKGVSRGVSEGVLAIANFFQNTAKINLRNALGTSSKSYVRTGKAQQSITVEKLGAQRARVRMGVKYGHYIEEGTGEPVGRTSWWVSAETLRKNGMVIDSKQKYVHMHGMKPRPFWMPAVKETRQKARSILSQYL